MISLAYSVKRMLIDKNFVKRLSSCEIMGGANNICSDKTGTLTKNKMSVVRIFLKEQTIDNPNKRSIAENLGEIISVGVSLNSSANPIFEGDKVDQIGNKTDCALLELARDLGYDYRKIRKESEQSLIKVLPFSSETKTMSSVVNYKGKVHIFTKGAPDFLIKSCTKYIDAAGNAVDITRQFANTLNEKLKEFADGTLRTLLLAYKEDGSINQTS